ncbi:phage portal protein [Clostridium baratii]
MLDANKITKIINDDSDRREKILTAKRYYDNENDIEKSGVVPSDSSDPVRNADNRISHNFHQLLVNEKAAYMFTYPVIFDLNNNKELNESINELLGDDFESIAQDLCIEASNTGVAWLHYWIATKADDTNKNFEYAMVDTEQIIPVYSKSLKRKLVEVYRYYSSTDEKNKDITIFEHWNDKEFTKYTLEGSPGASLRLIDEETIKHELEKVPFIEFDNNRKCKSDLSKYKDLIDLYDKVMSGFANDLEDIQQIIYILENYGGADLKQFTQDLKRYKSIKVDGGASGGAKGDVRTLQIDIPVEARKVVLEALKKQIYESGQGLQQDVESFGNASGVALKFFYRKLELKAGFTETEFKKGFGSLIRAILRFLKKDDTIKINQTYTRNMISNDLENSEIAKNSIGIIPTKIILRNHPWVDDLEEAEKLLKSENEEIDPYKDLVDKTKGNNNDE